MKRERRFAADLKVTPELLRDSVIPVEPVVRDQLTTMLSRDLIGPRGGRYIPFGDIEYLGSAVVGEDFIRGYVTYRARRMGRYVRPQR